MDPTALDPREVAAVFPVKFWTDYDEKNGQMVPCDWVKYAKKGTNNTATDEKVERIKRNRAVWMALETYYVHWKKGEEAPVNGHPLATWPGISREQADKLKLLHIRTVEDVALMNDETMNRIGMGALKLKQDAVAFMDAKKGDAAVAAQLVSRDNQIKELQDQVSNLIEQLTELSGKRGPGRPKKADAGSGDA
jgi:hypothetical protein